MATGGIDDSTDSRTTCSICFEPYKGRSPKLLPCFHTFCLPCLVMIKDKALREATKAECNIQDDDCCGDLKDVSNTTDTSPGLSIVCPTCRKPNPIPPGGVTQFQTNFYLDGDNASDSAVDAAENKGPSTVVRTAQDQLRVMEAMKAKLAGEKLEVENQMRAVETDIQNRYTLAVNCAAEARNKCSSSLKAAGLAIQDKLEVELMLAENMRSKLSHFLSEQTSQRQPCPTDGESVLLTDAAMRHFRTSAEKSSQPEFFTYRPGDVTQALKDSLDDFMGRVAVLGQVTLKGTKGSMGVGVGDARRNVTNPESLQAEVLKLRQELDFQKVHGFQLQADVLAVQKAVQAAASVSKVDVDITQLRADLAALKTAVQTDLSKSIQAADYARLSSDLAALQKALRTDTSKLKQELKQDISSVHKDCTALGVSFATAERKIEQIKAENKRLDTKAHGAAAQKVKRTTSVAFHAELDRDVKTKGRRTLYLREVISNIGGAYNAQSGIFTAPVTGIYIFLATTSPQGEVKQANLQILQEGKHIAYILAEGDGSTSCHAAVRVAVGERVWLESYDDDTYSFAGDGITSFTGILVQEEL